jgi:hypothetical protein
MTFTIDRLHAVSDTPKRPVTYLPTKLDAAACLDVLDRINVLTEIAAATGEYLDIKDVDKALAKTSLNTSERMRLKTALTAHGLLSAGRKVS